MKKLATFSLAIMAMGIMTLSTIQAQFVIDDFSAGTNNLTHDVDGNANDRQGPLTGTIDNSMYRDLVIRNFGGSQGSGNTGTVSSGSFSYTRGPGPNAADVQLTYNNMAFPTNGNWDYTGLAGQSAIEVSFLTNTTSALKVSVQAEKYDSGFANFTQSATSSSFVTTTGGASTVSVDLAPLDLSTFGAIDNLLITFSYDPQPYVFNDTISQSFSISEINAVPEPSTVALLGLGVLGLIAARRRKA